MLITYIRLPEKCEFNKKCRNCQYYRPSLKYRQTMYCKINRAPWKKTKEEKDER